MDSTLASSSPASHRKLAIAGGVLLFHAAALWGLQTGLLRRAAEVIVPVEILAEIVPPPAPPLERPPEVKPPPPAPRPVARQKVVAPPPAPRPVATPSLPPAANAPTGVVEPQPVAPPIAAPVAAAPAPAPAAPAPAAPAPAKVELPSTDADYLQNPKPLYPAMSKRLGEQGKVLVRVLIGADGTAKEAQIRQSSGFDRLDQAALDTVRKWRYVPGKRGGVAEAMWFNVPINFVLEQ